jgi:pseudouridine synthase
MTNLIRINKYIALCTGTSRRKAEEFVKAGHVNVNGRTIYQLSTKVSPLDDVVLLNHKKLTPKLYVYYALNKPLEYTSTTFDPFAQHKVTDLVPQNPKVFPVGRLDKNSEGLIILTNDGDFANRITHPSSHVAKEYFVVAQIYKKDWTVSDLKRMERGVYIDHVKTQPAKINTWHHKGNTIEFHVELKEGKKRQVRKMTHIIGAEVTKLQRVRIGKLKLGNLATGEYRKIMPEEVI